MGGESPAGPSRCSGHWIRQHEGLGSQLTSRISQAWRTCLLRTPHPPPREPLSKCIPPSPKWKDSPRNPHQPPRRMCPARTADSRGPGGRTHHRRRGRSILRPSGSGGAFIPAFVHVVTLQDQGLPEAAGAAGGGGAPGAGSGSSQSSGLPHKLAGGQRKGARAPRVERQQPRRHGAADRQAAPLTLLAAPCSAPLPPP